SFLGKEPGHLFRRALLRARGSSRARGLLISLVRASTPESMRGSTAKAVRLVHLRRLVAPNRTKVQIGGLRGMSPVWHGQAVPRNHLSFVAESRINRTDRPCLM